LKEKDFWSVARSGKNPVCKTVELMGKLSTGDEGGIYRAADATAGCGYKQNCGHSDEKWPEREDPKKRFMAGGGTWVLCDSTNGSAPSTGRNEPSGLSTVETVNGRITNVIEAGYAGCDHGSLHPQRPSGRSPHRPLTFSGRLKFAMHQPYSSL
jgi:hypothetical protein